MVINYWLKIIRDEQLEILKEERCSGMSWGSIKNVRKINKKKTFSQFDAYEKVQIGDEMLFKITNKKNMFKGKVISIEWESIEKFDKYNDNHEWVHCFYYTNIKSLGKIDLWKNKEKIKYLKKFKFAGFSHKTGMWKLPKEDFDKIVGLGKSN